MSKLVKISSTYLLNKLQLTHEAMQRSSDLTFSMALIEVTQKDYHENMEKGSFYGTSTKGCFFDIAKKNDTIARRVQAGDEHIVTVYNFQTRQKLVAKEAAGIKISEMQADDFATLNREHHLMIDRDGIASFLPA